jgi:glycosidase
VHGVLTSPFCFALLFLRSPLPNFSLDTLHTSLATETEYVREELAAYANDLISLGVDGLRLDAAKRMSPSVVFILTFFVSDVSCSFRRH